MATTREQIAAMAKIDTLSFWAQSLSGGGRRNLVGHGGIGVQGQEFEDLGEDARTEIMRAEMDELDYLKLEEIRRAGKRVSAQHPLFGVMQARIMDVQYQAGLADMVDVTITLVEDGERKKATVAAAPNITTQTFKWDGNKDDTTQKSAELTADGFTDHSNVDTFVSSGQTTAEASFENTVNAAADGDVSIDEVSAEYEAYIKATLELIRELEALGGDYSDLTDLYYESIEIAQDSVRSVSILDQGPWETFIVRSPVLLGNLAKDFLGADNDDNIDLLLEHNPQLIDAGTVPAGSQIVIPVSL